MTFRLYRSFQALILVLLGLFLLNKVFNLTVLWYIHPRFLPLTLFAAIGLIWLAYLLQRSQPRMHGDESVLPLLILSIPLVLSLLIPVHPLETSAIESKWISGAPSSPSTSSASHQQELPSTERTILDWLRAFDQADHPSVYVGQPAEVVGFVYHDPRLPEGQFLLSRFTFSCCVADATAIGVIVEWPQPSDLPNDTWVRITGPVRVGHLDSQLVPLVQAHTVEAIPEPEQPYLYN